MYSTHAVLEVRPSREITFSVLAWQIVSGRVPVIGGWDV